MEGGRATCTLTAFACHVTHTSIVPGATGATRLKTTITKYVLGAGSACWEILAKKNQVVLWKISVQGDNKLHEIWLNFIKIELRGCNLALSFLENRQSEQVVKRPLVLLERSGDKAALAIFSFERHMRVRVRSKHRC